MDVPLNRQIYSDAVIVSALAHINLFLVAESIGYVGKDMGAMLKAIAGDLAHDEWKWDLNPLGGDYDVEDVSDYCDERDTANRPNK